MHEDSKTFYKLGGGLENIDVIYWNDNSAVGFTIFRKYPERASFIPVKNKDGVDDNVAMVKIGYIPNQIKNNKVRLIVSVHKISHYLQKKFSYDFEDPECPSRQAVETSERSRQPIDLEDTDRFEYNLDTNQILDTETGILNNLRDIINYIYDLHIRTIDAHLFKSLLKFNSFLVDFPSYVIPWFKKILLAVGKELTEDKNDFSLGFYKSYSYKKHVRRLQVDKLSLWGLEIPIFAFRLTSGLIIALLLIKFYGGYDLFGLVSFITFVESSELYKVSLAVVLLYLADEVLPWAIFFLLNGSIYIRRWALNRRIKFY